MWCSSTKTLQLSNLWASLLWSTYQLQIVKTEGFGASFESHAIINYYQLTPILISAFLTFATLYWWLSKFHRLFPITFRQHFMLPCTLRSFQWVFSQLCTRLMPPNSKPSPSLSMFGSISVMLFANHSSIGQHAILTWSLLGLIQFWLVFPTFTIGLY